MRTIWTTSGKYGCAAAASRAFCTGENTCGGGRASGPAARQTSAGQPLERARPLHPGRWLNGVPHAARRLRVTLAAPKTGRAPLPHLRSPQAAAQHARARLPVMGRPAAKQKAHSMPAARAQASCGWQPEGQPLPPPCPLQRASQAGVGQPTGGAGRRPFQQGGGQGGGQRGQRGQRTAPVRPMSCSMATNSASRSELSRPAALNMSR